ncbi:DUF3613 domain-containing protein [Stenotrophomonas sp. ATs4]|uniref:DUF3613 domain-containing protein n=1 Tax=Stenotrophomonas sp. ATs4 TaxID=3402766 RepID=UPI003F71E0A6
MIATLLIRRLLPMWTCLLVVGAVQAQQQPLTGQMLGGSGPAAPTSQPLQSEALATVDLAPASATAPAAAPSPATRVAAQPPAVVARPGRSQIGDATRSLFHLQASGQQAGQQLPILGDQATLSYARYIKSFEHEIPDFFETDVAKSKGTSSSGR